MARTRWRPARKALINTAMFVILTVWLIQLGSTESKPVGEEGKETDKEQKVGRYAEPSSPAWSRPSPGPRAPRDASASPRPRSGARHGASGSRPPRRGAARR